MSLSPWRRPFVLGLLLSFSQLSFGHAIKQRKDLVPRDNNVMANINHNWGTANDYGSYENLCNTPKNRQCWIKNKFDVNTDYEYNWPKGVQREYWLVIDEAPADFATPDGHPRDTPMKLINGTYPGPLIEANWGDELIVHVTNKLPDSEGATIHWHGLRQFGTPQFDGVNGVSQCPIGTGQTMTYKFTATEYGHSWYHSHYNLQYPDGVLGPLVIHGPTSANWDTVLGDLMISDYYQKGASVLFEGELRQDFAIANGTTINGHGMFPCQGTRDNPACDNEGKGSRYQATVQRGKKYLLRIINTSTATQFAFAIDNHHLQIVHVDFVPVKPYTVDSINVGVGQRYEVIVEMNPDYDSPMGPQPTDENFWIRTIPLDNCTALDTSFPTFGILRYEDAPDANPTSREIGGTDENNGAGIDTACVDEKASNMVPLVPWTVGKPADDTTFNVGLHAQESHGFFRWEISDTPMWLDHSNPTILNLDNDTYKPEWAVFTNPNYSDDDWVYFIIQGSFQDSDQKKSIPTAHPMHLHGHDFVILAQGDGVYTDDVPLNLENPARRDVALLNSKGYLVLAFKSNNPGIWLLHCHIAWHASSGLALQIIERANDIPKTIDNIEGIKDQCHTWSTASFGTGPDRLDSGV